VNRACCGIPTALGWLCAFLLSGCAALPTDKSQSGEGEIVVAGMVIRNELAYTVTDVMIEVPKTGAFAGCGNILPRSACSTTFEQIGYRGNPMVVSWREHGQPQRMDEFVLPVPDAALPGDTFVVEVRVFAPGQAGAQLVETDPEEVRNR
jgi:hypothetical protein